MAPRNCPLCGIDFDTTGDEDGQREGEEAEFVRPEEHYGPCMEGATRKLRMELELMRMQKEHDAIQEIQEQARTTSHPNRPILFIQSIRR